MNLHKATKSEFKAIRALYTSAFPINERAPLFFMRRRALQNRATMLVAEENGEFIGFAYTAVCGDFVYLFYFAVAQDKRNNGNGSEFLRLLKEYFKNKTIFLAREPLDDTAQNNKDRIRRRDFYIRNGFTDRNFQVTEANGIFDIMSSDEKLTPSDYNALVKNWAGEFALRFVKMEAVD